VLRALYRLGVRAVQFSTQACFNAYADAEPGTPTWHGINAEGRELVRTMNELGVLIDVTHATPPAQAQIIDCSEAPVVASHCALTAISGDGAGGIGLLSGGILRAIAAEGGMVGIIGAGARLTRRFREWQRAHPDDTAQVSATLTGEVEFTAPSTGSLCTTGNSMPGSTRSVPGNEPRSNCRRRTPLMSLNWCRQRTSEPPTWHTRPALSAGPRRHRPGHGQRPVPLRARQRIGLPRSRRCGKAVVGPAELGGVADQNWLRVLDTVLGG
jgi:Membrane dipeptidase (Peptidase family M19)